MKISKLENDMLKIAVEISRFRNGEPVFLADLRARLPEMSKDVFDQAILTMEKNCYFLTRHYHPAQATAAERESYIPDGKGNYFIAINPRDGAEIPKKPVDPQIQPGQFPNKDHSLDSIFANMKPARGGSREGAGRPAVKTKVKRVPLAGARIPGWLMDWLKAEGNMGAKIEQALIAQYGLTPPGEE